MNVRRWGAVLAPAMLFAAGCSDDSGRSRSQRITIAELDDQLDQSAALVELDLSPGTLFAREVHVDRPDDEEKIASTVAAIDTTSATITLSLGGLDVHYGDASDFRGSGDDGAAMTREMWEAAVTSGMPIEARRDVPSVAQSPSDPAFFADDLRIAGDEDEPKLELLVDGDNLDVASATVATLHVLGIEVAIGGATEITSDGGGPDDGAPTPTPAGTPGNSVEFEGAVSSVDVMNGTLTLSSGTVVDANGATFDPAGDLYSLTATSEALMEDETVRAEGQGSEATDGTIVATIVKIEVDD